MTGRPPDCDTIRDMPSEGRKPADMECPRCSVTVAADAWCCPHCEHIIDPSFLQEDDSDLHEETTRLFSYNDGPASEPQGAIILGDVKVQEDQFAAAPNLATDQRTPSFVYFTGDAAARVVHPDAVPIVVGALKSEARSENVDALLRSIDGQASVRELQKRSGLSPQDAVGILLMLRDEGVIDLPEAKAVPAGSRRRRSRVTRRPLGISEPYTGRHERPTALAPDRRRTPGPDLEITAPPPALGLPEDFDELPAISDVEELVEPSSASAGSAGGASWTFSDVWAQEDAVPAINAAALIEDEALVGTNPDSPPGVEPRIVSAGGRWTTGVRAALDVAEGRAQATRDLSPSPIALPKVSRPPSNSVVERLTSRARRAPEERPTSVPVDLDFDEEDLPPVVPQDGLGSPDDVAHTKEVPVPLSPQFLQEVEPEGQAEPAPPPAMAGVATGPVSQAVALPLRTGPMLPESRAGARPLTPRPEGITPRAPASPMTRGLDAPLLPASAEPPVEGVDAPVRPSLPPLSGPAVDPGEAAAQPVNRESRSRLDKLPRPDRPLRPTKPLESPPSPERAKAEENKVDPPPKRSRRRSDGVDSVRVLKAEKLFEQAQKDKAEGNLVSARMNVKLALTFDPRNEQYMVEFEKLNRNPKAKPRSISSLRNEARALYEKATEAERRGDIDRAVQLLESAIAKSRRAPFLNRLGIILAMKKRQFERAQTLLEEAVQLMPSNTTYARNLHKVLAVAAATGPGGGAKKSPAGNLLRGILGRRK